MEQALQEARGKYIFYLEEKHALEADCIETLVASAEQYGSDVVLTHFKTYDENNGMFYFHESGLTTGELQADAIATLLSSSYRNKVYLEHAFGKLFTKDWLVKQHVSIYNNFLEKYSYETARLSYVHKVNYLYREEKQELVSVIVPVYNVEPYLSHCLESIVNQSYPNLEILLINDGSTDRSGEICEEYAQRDERIRVIHQENAGLSAARNTGLDQMTGDYVTFVDSDDAIDVHFVASCYENSRRYDADVVMGSYYKLYEENYSVEFYSIIGVNKTRTFFTTEQLLNSLYETMVTVTAWGKLYKASLFDTIRYPDGKVYEDAYIAHKIYLEATRVLLLNTHHYMYRIRNDSITGSSNFSISHALNRLEYLEERLVDFHLANQQTGMARWAYIKWLHTIKSELEAHHLSDSNEYLRIVNKLSFLD